LQQAIPHITDEDLRKAEDILARYENLWNMIQK